MHFFFKTASARKSSGATGIKPIESLTCTGGIGQERISNKSFICRRKKGERP